MITLEEEIYEAKKVHKEDIINRLKKKQGFKTDTDTENIIDIIFSNKKEAINFIDVKLPKMREVANSLIENNDKNAISFMKKYLFINSLCKTIK